MNAELSNRFQHHAPSDRVIEKAHELIRTKCAALAAAIDSLVPDSREKSLAMTNLEQTMFWANASVARNQVTTLNHLARKSGETDPEAWP